MDPMSAAQSTADVAVVGLGRVGLPLALAFADRGLEVVGIDNDPARLDAVRDGRMPFQETGAQALLDRVRASGRLSLSERVADAARARQIVITLGTPSFSHIEIDMRDIRSALDDLLGVLAPGHSLILRSTVAPGTTEFVAGYLAKHRGFDDRRGRVRGACARADRRGPVPGGDRHAAMHHRRRRAPARETSWRSCSECSMRRSCRRPRCRPSWRRSGRTSCATRTSPCPTC